MNTQTILLVTVALLSLLLMYLLNEKNKNKNKFAIIEEKSLFKFHNNHPTRSFSSENEIKDPRQKYLSNPTKCFSCEKDVLRNAGPKYINFAFPGKCFSCERQSKTPYHEGPTKCFSCE